MDPNRKRDLADRADTATSVTAGAVGGAFGAAKLRDSFAEDHPDKAKAVIARGHAALRSHGVSAQRAGRLAEFAEHSKPHFGSIAIGSAAAASAAAAGKYSSHVKNSQAKEARRARDAAARAESAQAPVAKSAFGVGHPIVKVWKNAAVQPPGFVGANPVGAPKAAPAKPARAATSKAAPAKPAAAAPVAVKTKKVKTKPPKQAPAAEAPEPKPTVDKPKPVLMRARRASPSIPKAEEMYDEIRGATKGPSALGRHGPTVAAVAGGVAAGALIHRHHKNVSKSAFGVEHPEIEKVFVPTSGAGAVGLAAGKVTRRLAPHAAKAAKQVAPLAVKAAMAGKAHGAYIAGAAGVGSATAIGGVLANRARRAAPAIIDRKIAAKFPVPKAHLAIAGGAAGVGTAAALAHDRKKKETLTKSAFGVEHPRLRIVH
jgi:hypothetical protein